MGSPIGPRGLFTGGSEWWASWCAGAVLLAICAALYLPGFFTLPVVDRDEARFAQASRQMMAGGSLRDWVVPMVQERPRINKPPLVYWLQASSAAVITGRWTGSEATDAMRADAIWMYRMPSILAAFASALAVWRMGASMMDARASWLGAVLFAVCPVVVWEARQARADMVLVALTTLAVWALWEVWKSSGHSSGRVNLLKVLWLWGSIGAGVMTKGPVTPLIVTLTAVAFSLSNRDWTWMHRARPLLGCTIVAAMVAPWVVLVGNEVGWKLYLGTIWNETIGRSISASEGHRGPPGYHTVLMIVLFFPGSMLTGAALVRAARAGLSSKEVTASRWRVFAALRVARAKRNPGCYLLCVLVPFWVVLECVATKLPHYTLPLYPAVALLTARYLLGEGRAMHRISKLARAGVWVWFVAVVAYLTFSIVLAAMIVHRIAGAAALVACIAVGGIGVVVVLVILPRAIRSVGLVRAQVIGIFAYVPATGAIVWSLPHLSEPWVSHRIASGITEIDPCRTRPIVAVDFFEDSLVFETRGRAVRYSPERLLAGFVLTRRDPIVIVGDEATWREIGIDGREVAVVEGFNYSKGRKVRIKILDIGEGT